MSGKAHQYARGCCWVACVLQVLEAFWLQKLWVVVTCVSFSAVDDMDVIDKRGTCSLTVLYHSNNRESASILHRKVHYCILAIAEKQSTMRVDALGRNTYQSFVQSIGMCRDQARRMLWQLRSSSRMHTRINRSVKSWRSIL